ncbi:hypothetical protein BDQ17DRAFT_1260470, partial [Cyathus striatus]
ELHWAPQCTSALAKGQGWLSCIWHLTCPSSGANAHLMDCLYIATAIPCMLYAVDVLRTDSLPA